MKLFEDLDEDASPMSWSCLTPGKWERGEEEITPVISITQNTDTALMEIEDVAINEDIILPNMGGAKGPLFREKHNRIDEEDETPSRKRKRDQKATKNQRFTRFWSFQERRSMSTLFPRDDIIYDDDEDAIGTSSMCNDTTTVKNAVIKLSQEEDIVGDGSRSHSLPTIQGKHNDLKSITPETLSKLIGGDYNEVVERYEILDCRYPYEYTGGHIEGALNMYTKDDVLKLLNGSKETAENKKTILIFHCEFSSERAPKLCRFLRNKDREMNQASYPTLNYPELYILHGGYSSFFRSQQEHCQPQSYKPMLHEDHTADLRHFRCKSKSWTAGEKQKRPSRLSLRF